MKKWTRAPLVCSTAIWTAATAGTAAAQAPEQPQRPESVLNEDIVVTAQRREENVQKVPIAVTAIGGSAIRQLNIQDVQRVVDFVPNIKASGLGGAGGPPVFNIRGISFVDFSNLNEASVALYVDDIYQVAQGAGTQQVYDLERVEVLRGPQGTLFGRNSTAGLVHYITRKPTDTFEGELGAQYGRFNQVILNMAAGGPVTDWLRARFAAKYNRDDGWQKNIATDTRLGKTDAIAARVIVQADLAPDVMLEGKLSYARNDGQSPVHRPYFVLDPKNPSGYCGGRPVPGTPADFAHAACILAGLGVSRTAGQPVSGFSPSRGVSDQAEWPFNYRSWGGYLKLTAGLGFADLVSISGYDRYRTVFTYDADGYDNRPYGGPGSRDLGLFFGANSHTFSQEVRLSNATDGGLKWVAGAYYYDGYQHADTTTTTDRVQTDLIGYTTRTESYAGFGQLDVPITDQLTISGGARYTHDERRFAQPDCSRSITNTFCAPTPVTSINEGQWTYRLALDYQIDDDVLVYASHSSGFKSGGWNGNRNAPQRGPVGSEKIKNYEIGFKSQFLDRRLTLNTALFYYKYKGIQALIGTIDPLTGASTSLYINGGDPRTYGAELELNARVTDRLEVRLGGGYLDTKVIADPLFTADGRSLNGNRLAQAPKLSGNAIVRYTIPAGDAGDFTVQADGRYQTAVFSGIDNDPAERVKAYGIANARLQWRSASRKYTVEAFVDNLFDYKVLQQMFHYTLGSFPVTPTVNSPPFDSGFGVWGRPRTWGIRAGYNF